MSLSIHDTAVTTFKAMLGSLDRILSKAEAYAEARKFDPANLLGTRPQGVRSWQHVGPRNRSQGMSLSIHDTTVMTFKAMLGSLDRILAKAEAYAEARQFEPANLLQARLFPDMLDFTRQVQIACDLAKSGAARLAGIDPPRHEDTESTFAELHARIAKVLAFLDSVDRAAVDASGERTIVVPMRDRTLEFKGSDYVTQWVMPNFYFHYAHAYALLRHNGVELGKRDFLGQ